MTRALRRHLAEAGGLLNQGDIARMWNLSRPWVSDLVNKPTFPEPVAQVGGRDVWAMNEVLAWGEANPAPRKARA